MHCHVYYKPGFPDGRAVRTLEVLRAAVKTHLQSVSIGDVYIVDGVERLDAELAERAFCDTVCQTIEIDADEPASAGRLGGAPERAKRSARSGARPGWRYLIEVAYRPGVTDTVALTAREALELELGEPLPPRAVVQTARRYFIAAGLLKDDELTAIVEELHNPLVQQATTLTVNDWAAGARPPARYQTAGDSHEVSPNSVRRHDLAAMSPEELATLSREQLLALSDDELAALAAYYRDPEVRAEREAAGCSPEATDCELEMVAQTWSEHCKHKIFAAEISYYDDGAGDGSQGAGDAGAERGPLRIDGLFDTYIKATTETVGRGRSDLLSVFHDNSGVVAFDDEHVVCFKAETHNSPSALDPYGGAITGIVGVNRDIIGTGRGARPIFNTNVLCFGRPDTPADAIPRGLMHPKRIMAGVHSGIIDGGNQSGIPTVAGAFVFDESFTGKPLVFCGTGGIMPREAAGAPSHEKTIHPGDHAVMVGGRIGKDGIHGATFSSLALDETSPTSAVQIGDPITQKRMLEFLLEARDRGWIRSLTDNGAGGLSSSLGEMARDSGGVRVELDRCPLKYPGLEPWEIWVSESQERMSLAVAPEHLEPLLALAARRSVEATAIGSFTASGFVELLYGGARVAYMRLSFLHHGLPRMRLTARWISPEARAADRPAHALPGTPPTGAPGAAGAASTGGAPSTAASGAPPFAAGAPSTAASGGPPAPGAPPTGAPSPLDHELREALRILLADPNIASKEALVRQYDHEVQGGSVGKPYLGVETDGPGDGAVLRPGFDGIQGLSVTHGICPWYGDYDTERMAAAAVDEAYRAHIVLGGDPDRAYALDNFCWPDPVQSDATPDGEYKLAQLVRACRGLHDTCVAYNLPLISGKDSMKNDADFGGRKVSVRPTLLVSLMGIVPDVDAAVGTDFKSSGDLLYLAGVTYGELGGSAYARRFALAPEASPAVYPEAALSTYRALADAALRRLVSSMHDLSDGGLAVAAAESALAGRLGATLELGALSLGEELAAAGELAGSGSPEELRDHVARLLFCESASRILLSVPLEHTAEFESLTAGLPVACIGTVQSLPRLEATYRGERMLALEVEEIEAAYKTPFGPQPGETAGLRRRERRNA